MVEPPPESAVYGAIRIRLNGLAPSDEESAIAIFPRFLADSRTRSLIGEIAMAEIVKRLTPRKNTLRDLYLKSGNLCMYPDCAERILDKSGVVVGDICHIEAAEKGGERFNPQSSNEERRQFKNLMLMCQRHHRITNDVNVYTPDKLRGFKAAHEARFTDVAAAIGRAAVEDITKATKPVKPSRLESFGRELNWPVLEQEQMAENVKLIGEWIDRLGHVSPDSRRVFQILVERIDDQGKVPPSEIVNVVNISEKELGDHLSILERHRLIVVLGELDEFGTQIRVSSISSGDWPVASEIRLFAQASNIPLDLLLVQLDFSSLD